MTRTNSYNPCFILIIIPSFLYYMSFIMTLLWMIYSCIRRNTWCSCWLRNSIRRCIVCNICRSVFCSLVFNCLTIFCNCSVCCSLIFSYIRLLFIFLCVALLFVRLLCIIFLYSRVFLCCFCNLFCIYSLLISR